MSEDGRVKTRHYLRGSDGKRYPVRLGPNGATVLIGPPPPDDVEVLILDAEGNTVLVPMAAYFAAKEGQ